MKTCPFCAEEIQDDAIKCRYCGEFLDGRAAPLRAMSGYPAYYGWGYEYRSQLAIFGWPLLHVAHGIDPKTGLPRVAKGIIAIGNIAIGVFSIGGIAVGGVVLSGIGLGVFVLGGIAIGGLAVGGMSLALFLAVGGLAVSTMYAIGGMAIAPHAISSLGADPEFLRLLEKWWPEIREVFPRQG